MKSLTVAIIGTRKPEPEMVRVCSELCYYLSRAGHRLVTGNADGIDGLARDIWNKTAPERVTLVLPWPTYNRHHIHRQNKVVVFSDQQTWRESVLEHHPAGKRLGRGAFALHARNFGIAENAQVVVAFPSLKAGGGGTGQGIRIAKALNRPLFVLPKDKAALLEYVASPIP